MKTPFELFMAPYSAWLDYTRSMLTGGTLAAPAKELPPKAAPSAAEQEWEDEGGSVKPEKKQKLKPGSKLPN